MRKTFCIGFNKTGTVSLHHAFRELGLNSLHWAPANLPGILRFAAAQLVEQNVQFCIDHDLPLLTLIETYDVYLDVSAIRKNFKLIDQQYPDSRFILNTRYSVDAWIDSRRRHVLRNRKHHEEGRYRGNWLETNEEGWLAEWNRHHEDVFEYFDGRPRDLLVIDVTSGEGYDKLCPFLEVDIKQSAFPWRNRDRNR